MSFGSTGGWNTLFHREMGECCGCFWEELTFELEVTSTIRSWPGLLEGGWDIWVFQVEQMANSMETGSEG